LSITDVCGLTAPASLFGSIGWKSQARISNGWHYRSPDE